MYRLIDRSTYMRARDARALSLWIYFTRLYMVFWPFAFLLTGRFYHFATKISTFFVANVTILPQNEWFQILYVVKVGGNISLCLSLYLLSIKFIGNRRNCYSNLYLTVWEVSRKSINPKFVSSSNWLKYYDDLFFKNLNKIHKKNPCVWL